MQAVILTILFPRTRPIRPNEIECEEIGLTSTTIWKWRYPV